MAASSPGRPARARAPSDRLTWPLATTSVAAAAPVFIDHHGLVAHVQSQRAGKGGRHDHQRQAVAAPAARPRRRCGCARHRIPVQAAAIVEGRHQALLGAQAFAAGRERRRCRGRPAWRARGRRRRRRGRRAGLPWKASANRVSTAGGAHRLGGAAGQDAAAGSSSSARHRRRQAALLETVSMALPQLRYDGFSVAHCRGSTSARRTRLPRRLPQKQKASAEAFASCKVEAYQPRWRRREGGNAGQGQAEQGDAAWLGDGASLHVDFAVAVVAEAEVVLEVETNAGDVVRQEAAVADDAGVGVGVADAQRHCRCCRRRPATARSTGRRRWRRRRRSSGRHGRRPSRRRNRSRSDCRRRRTYRSRRCRPRRWQPRRRCPGYPGRRRCRW